MKKKFLFLLIIVLPFVFFSCNDFSIKWEAVTVDGKNGAKITEINIKNGYEPTIIIPSKVGGKPVLSLDLLIEGETRCLVVPESVIEISKISGGSSIESIEEIYAGIYGGDGINTLDLSRTRSLKILDGIRLPHLTEIKFPKTIKLICGLAFKDCRSLREIDLSNTEVEGICIDAFYYCSSLETIKFPKLLKSIPDCMFCDFRAVCLDDDYSGVLSFDYSDACRFDSLRVVDLSGTDIEIIGARAFCNCDSLETIKFPESLKSIDDEAFRYCYSLREVDLSNTQVKTIGKRAFRDCTRENKFLKEIKFPESLKSIGDEAFYYSSIKEIDLSNTQVETIGARAFYGSKLEKIKFPKSLKSVFDDIFVEFDPLYRSWEHDIEPCTIKEIVLPYPDLKLMILDSKSYPEERNKRFKWKPVGFEGSITWTIPYYLSNVKYTYY